MQICRLIIVGLLASVVSLASVGGLLSEVCFTSDSLLKEATAIYTSAYNCLCAQDTLIVLRQFEMTNKPRAGAEFGMLVIYVMTQ